MSLVKFDVRQLESKWGKRDENSIRHKSKKLVCLLIQTMVESILNFLVPDGAKKPIIDYEKLKELCGIDGLHTVYVLIFISNCIFTYI